MSKVLDFLSDEWPACLFGGLMIVTILGALWALVVSTQYQQMEHKRLMTQCLAHGKQEYECVGLLRKANDGAVFIPIIIPVR